MGTEAERCDGDTRYKIQDTWYKLYFIHTIELICLKYPQQMLNIRTDLMRCMVKISSQQSVYYKAPNITILEYTY